ncbi:hypothetical protein CRYUN_Cryun15aG0072700 [Craigia yunnanensis]
MTVTQQKLVDRLKMQNGRYIALHLRYEKYMLAFTGCTYAYTTFSKYLSKENPEHWKVKNINSTDQRIGGFCPLTLKEVGIFLQALGYPPSTLIYVASGEIYGPDARLSEIKSRFLNLVFKLKAFAKHASQSATLDYTVSIESDVFVPSYSGHRRFLGHRKTINPARKGLVRLFDELESGQQREASSFSYFVRQMHKNRQGAPRKRKGPSPGIKGKARLRTEESFYENPYPECYVSQKLYKIVKLIWLHLLGMKTVA